MYLNNEEIEDLTVGLDNDTMVEDSVLTYIENEELTYNIKNHKYFITNDGFLDRTGIELVGIINIANITDKDTAIKIFINRVSQDIYGYIYGQVHDRYVIEYMLAHDVDFNNSLCEALYMYAEYLLTNESVFDRGSIDMNTKTNISMAVLTKNALPLNVYLELESSNILFNGKWTGFDKSLLDNKGVAY